MTAARYDPVAEFYVEGWRDVDDPVSSALLDLLGPVAGERVLDVACGHGRVSRALARRGADVVGVDISAALLAHAAQAQADEPLAIRYVRADASTMDWLDDRSYSAAVCSFGLSDVDNLDGCLETVAHALRPGGRFVFSIIHPCFPGAGDASGSWPTGGSYYDEVRWVADGASSHLRRQVGANHRMLSTYVNHLRTYGLIVDRVTEPEPPEPWRLQHPDAARYPLYLVVRCTAVVE